MLLSVRVAPTLAKYAQMRYASYQPLLMKSVACINSPTYSTMEKNHYRFSNVSGGNVIHSSMRHSDILTSRCYSTQPSLPSKTEVERAFFKVTVVIWDLVAKVLAWCWAMFRKRIIGHHVVQTKWKVFNQKLEEARKD